jgi:hypothetical protein
MRLCIVGSRAQRLLDVSHIHRALAVAKLYLQDTNPKIFTRFPPQERNIMSAQNVYSLLLKKYVILFIHANLCPEVYRM